MTGGKPKTNRYLEEIRGELDATGVPWTAENGKRHLKIFIGGELALVIPRGSFTDGNKALTRKSVQNIRAAAARSARPTPAP